MYPGYTAASSPKPANNTVGVKSRQPSGRSLQPDLLPPGIHEALERGNFNSTTKSKQIFGKSLLNPGTAESRRSSSTRTSKHVDARRLRAALFVDDCKPGFLALVHFYKYSLPSSLPWSPKPVFWSYVNEILSVL